VWSEIRAARSPRKAQRLPDAPTGKVEEEPLRYPAFRLFWFSRVATTLGSNIIAVAVGWQMYALTNSALNLGLIGLTQFIPLIALVLVVGHVADRYDRRVIGRSAQLLQALCGALLLVANLAGTISPPLIYVAVLFIGIARAFEVACMQALMPNLVPPQIISAAAARWTASNQTAVIIGPAVGGFLYAVAPAVAYGAVAVLYATAAVMMVFIVVGPRVIDRERPTMKSLLAGFTFIRHQPVVLGAISLDLFAVLLGGATALLPIYARDVLVMGPWGLGLLRSAPAVGALAMSFYLGRHRIRRHAGRIMFIAVAIFGIATIVFGTSRSFELSFGALVFLGMADVISVVIRSALVAILTPDEMRGRVAAVNSVFIGTSNQLGEFRAGVTAAWLGPVGAVLLGGIGSILVALIGSRVFSELARTESPETAVST
jgi:MFS family permease